MSNDDTSKIDGPSSDPDWVPTVRDVRKAVWGMQEQGERLCLYLDRPGGEPRQEANLVHVLQAFLMGPLGQYSDYLVDLDDAEERAYADLAGRTYDDYVRAMADDLGQT